jgi:hypothetical protein
MVSFAKKEDCIAAYNKLPDCGYYESGGRWYLKQYSQAFSEFISSHPIYHGKLVYSVYHDTRHKAEKRNLALFPKTLAVFSQLQGKKRAEIADILVATGEWVLA